MKGVQKGAMTLEQAETKFENWLQEKTLKISSAKNQIELDMKNSSKKRHENEVKVNEAKAAAVAHKLNKLRLDQAAQAAEAAEEAQAAQAPVAEAEAAPAEE